MLTRATDGNLQFGDHRVFLDLGLDRWPARIIRRILVTAGLVTTFGALMRWQQNLVAMRRGEERRATAGVAGPDARAFAQEPGDGGDVSPLRRRD